LCVRCGIPWQGLIHDLSKYSPDELGESARYFHGDKSPLAYCKKDVGYSKAWIHHKGRNKHHHEYWYDYDAPDKTPIIPYKYVVELICDNLAASMTYKKKTWTTWTQYEYWMKRKDKFMINEHTNEMIIEILKQVGEQGINKTLTKENLTKLYAKYCNPKKNEVA
jgi:hypothetical protein